MKTEIVTKEPEAIEVKGSPADMIRIAVQSGADLEKLEKLLTLMERWEATEAKKAFHKAMAIFKANAPKLLKDKHVNYATQKGRVSYDHATLGKVCEVVNSELSKHGLSSAWRTNQNGQIQVTCRVTHELGHSEETMLSANADDSGSKNSIQAIGSTITYLQRYTLLSLLGLATEDQDTDGVTADNATIDEKQLSTLLDYITSTETNEAKFLEVVGAEALSALPKSKYQKAVSMLKAKAEKMKGGKK